MQFVFIYDNAPLNAPEILMNAAKINSLPCVSTMPDDIYAEAAQQWDLPRLYADLTVVKRACNGKQNSALTELEKDCLRGLLCGHSPTEIALRLNRDVTGLRVSLSRDGLYDYLEVLTEQRPKNWQQIAFILERSGYRLNAVTLSAVPTKSAPRQDLAAYIDVSRFYGRSAEQATLHAWLTDFTVRVAAIVGMGGIGKTSLVAKLIQDSFSDASLEKAGVEGVLWRSLRDAPPIGELVQDIRQFVTDSTELTITSTIDQQISHLLSELRQRRFLIVLDDWETLLQEGELSGYCAIQYRGYSRLLQRFAAEQHQSCLVVLSREQPIELAAFAGEPVVQSLKLRGLQPADAKTLLNTRGFAGQEAGLSELVSIYRGNPAALKLIGALIQDICDGQVSQFLAQTSLVLGDVLSNLLEQQLSKLSDAERNVMFWLAIVGKPTAIADLKLLMSTEERSHLLTALGSLWRRSLIEKNTDTKRLLPESNCPATVPLHSSTPLPTLFSLEPVVMKCVLHQLVDALWQDVETVIEARSISHLGILKTHLLLKDEETFSITLYHVRRILYRVRDRLVSTFAGDVEQLSDQLQQILGWLKDQPPEAIGYAEINLTKLLELINLSQAS